MSATEPEISWAEHWQTWSINAGYYGVLFDTEDRDVTAYSSEWHATEEDARAVAARHAEIVAALEQHAPPNAFGTRRYRLHIQLQPDGSLSVREYDWNLFRFDIKPS
jgi:hypothetical protein